MIDVMPCDGHRDAVDLVDSRYPDGERLHLISADWTEFLTAVKAGKYDRVLPALPIT